MRAAPRPISSARELEGEESVRRKVCLPRLRSGPRKLETRARHEVESRHVCAYHRLDMNALETKTQK